MENHAEEEPELCIGQKLGMIYSLYIDKEAGLSRTGRVNGGTIVLCRDRTERSRTIPSFQKKNERLEHVLKNIGTISKRTERNGTEIA